MVRRPRDRRERGGRSRMADRFDRGLRDRQRALARRPAAASAPRLRPRTGRARRARSENGLVTATAPPKAGRREWIGLLVISLPCLLYSMDLTVLHLAVP